MASPTYNFDDLIKANFQKDAPVEISSDDDGFRGSWYIGKIIRPVKKSKTNPKISNRKNVIRKILVEYETLLDDDGIRPLREELDVVQVRPLPPCEKGVPSFKLGDEVDAYFNDGWWEGIVVDLSENQKVYSVYFRSSREQLKFEAHQLRLHREWVRGVWVPALREIEDIRGPGKPVEVSSDEEGFQGAWFAATVVKRLDNGKYLVEYKLLRNDDDTEFLREEAESRHIRPCPPDTKPVDRFKVKEQVDAFYNDGWWMGEISRVLTGQRYSVHFKLSNEKIDFKHSDLRPRQDWIDGKWVIASTEEASKS